MKELVPYQQRMVEELDQLQKLVLKLRQFLDSAEYRDLDLGDQHLLLKQLDGMQAYEHYLELRVRKAKGLALYRAISVVEAKPMTRYEYNEHRGWTIPADEDPKDPGYMTVNKNDGHVTWVPKETFEASFKELNRDLI